LWNKVVEESHLIENQRSLAGESKPWGGFSVLEDLPTHKVKRIWVNPGQRLSYQKHFKRSEHWIILEGKAKVTIDGNEILLSDGESVDIPHEAAHRIENIGDTQLTFIEVQMGDYFGEDDIHRLEDDYGRVP
jgi:mannose-6-phosphate isomerase